MVRGQNGQEGQLPPPPPLNNGLVLPFKKEKLSKIDLVVFKCKLHTVPTGVTF